MRLGGIAVHPGRLEALEAFCEGADAHGISAIVAPQPLYEMSEEEAARFGEAAASVGLVIGEAGYWENLLVEDDDLRAKRVSRLRRVLRNADAMKSRSVAILPGSHHASDKSFAADGYMRTQEAADEVRALLLDVLDEIDSERMRIGMEPYAANFFYHPEAVLEFIDSVGDPRFGLHLDLANMLTVETFFYSAKMIEEWFPHLAPHAVSCHIKDLDWPVSPYGLAWREVDLGDGVIDLGSYLRAVDTLDPDMCVYCEHYVEKADYLRNFEKAHAIAAANGLRFLPRHQAEGTVQ